VMGDSLNDSPKFGVHKPYLVRDSLLTGNTYLDGLVAFRLKLRYLMETGMVVRVFNRLFKKMYRKDKTRR